MDDVRIFKAAIEYPFPFVAKGLKNDGRPFERRYFTKEQIPEDDGSSFYNYFAEGCHCVYSSLKIGLISGDISR
jgi:hypothetical protein